MTTFTTTTRTSTSSSLFGKLLNATDLVESMTVLSVALVMVLTLNSLF